MNDEHSMRSGREHKQDAGLYPDSPDQVLPGPHTGAPEDIPEHNTAPDGQPGDVRGVGDPTA